MIFTQFWDFKMPIYIFKQAAHMMQPAWYAHKSSKNVVERQLHPGEEGNFLSLCRLFLLAHSVLDASECE